MSTEPSPSPGAGRSLGEYVSALIETLGRADAAALVRMQHIVRGRRARIRLDDEEVEIRFAEGTLVVEPGSQAAVDGTGGTDRATVLDLMDGNLEVSDAILSGRLDVVGDVDAVAAMFAAIEILLDASSRSPELQALAREFRERPAREPRRGPVRDRAGVTPRPAERAVSRERALLARLDLLPKGADLRPHRL
jgi:SCP-2 sterol transfer family